MLNYKKNIETQKDSIEEYHKVYSNTSKFMRAKLKWRGIHTTIFHSFRDEISNSKIIDIGCGYGRFPLIASHIAEEIMGIDMIPEPINIAKQIQMSSNRKNITYKVSTIEELAEARKNYFDIAILGGVLEHLTNPDSVIKAISSTLNKNGKLIINSPLESNFRGDISSLLLNLFHFPMSLTDVRVINPDYISQLAEKHSFEVTQTIGCCYERAWGKMAYTDLEKRIPKVLSDIRATGIDIYTDIDAFMEWVKIRTEGNRKLLDNWINQGFLKRIPDRKRIKLDEDSLYSLNLPVDDIKEYLAPVFDHDPYFCEYSPINTLGGQGIFCLRKT